MKAIIIGTPGKGKTTLANRLKESFPDTHIISIGGIRTPLGIHEPHKGYPTEVSPENTKFLYDVLDVALSTYENIILEGYGLSPEDALSLGEKHHCPAILLCHKSTTAIEDFNLARQYDSPGKWTNRRTDEYLMKLYSFYKEVELEWIKCFSETHIFDTSTDFENALKQAECFIKEKTTVGNNDQDETMTKNVQLYKVVTYIEKSLADEYLQHIKSETLNQIVNYKVSIPEIPNSGSAEHEIRIALLTTKNNLQRVVEILKNYHPYKTPQIAIQTYQTCQIVK